ncbi:hypothetical protein GQ42DRAFT_86829 [Ramicandelaber brevisporus]|nr:hypothetical protein GQ42DRAFT_86829 [Ramicandelaber brevisporus]
MPEFDWRELRSALQRIVQALADLSTANPQQQQQQQQQEQQPEQQSVTTTIQLKERKLPSSILSDLAALCEFLISHLLPQLQLCETAEECACKHPQAGSFLSILSQLVPQLDGLGFTREGEFAFVVASTLVEYSKLHIDVDNANPSARLWASRHCYNIIGINPLMIDDEDWQNLIKIHIPVRRPLSRIDSATTRVEMMRDVISKAGHSLTRRIRRCYSIRGLSRDEYISLLDAASPIMKHGDDVGAVIALVMLEAFILPETTVPSQKVPHPLQHQMNGGEWRPSDSNDEANDGSDLLNDAMIALFLGRFYSSFRSSSIDDQSKVWSFSKSARILEIHQISIDCIPESMDININSIDDIKNTWAQFTSVTKASTLLQCISERRCPVDDIFQTIASAVGEKGCTTYCWILGACLESIFVRQNPTRIKSSSSKDACMNSLCALVTHLVNNWNLTLSQSQIPSSDRYSVLLTHTRHLLGTLVASGRFESKEATTRVWMVLAAFPSWRIDALEFTRRKAVEAAFDDIDDEYYNAQMLLKWYNTLQF